MDLSGKEAASASITASFSNSLTGASGMPIDMEGLGVSILPLPIPIQDHTGEDEHTAKDDCSESKGMATYNFHTMLASLRIMDTPVGYRPPYGPPVPFTVTYTQRGASQPAVFDYSNLGPKWNLNWLTYITDDPVDFKAVSSQNRAGGGKLITEFVATSGANHTYRFLGRPSMQLKRPTASPLPYEITYPDGSKEIYGKSDGSTVAPRRVFLTQRIDPTGNITSINYDAQLRITSISDALGQQTVITYGLPSDPLKVTKVTDPFDRFASFEYDTLGRLVKITDVIGIQSVFTYEGTSDFIDSLTTPYGTTRFTNTVNGSVRRITATDPAGDTEVLESNALATAGIPDSDPSNSIPAGMSVFNTDLSQRNSFYWNKKQWKEAPNDYTKAHIFHWLADSNFTSMSGFPESEKPPLQSRIWYSYPGQTMLQGVGTGKTPSKIGRVIEGGTQLIVRGITPLDKVSSETDPLGRVTNYNYSTDGIDLSSISQNEPGGPAILSTVIYDARHRPLTVADAAGQISHYTWNTNGQIASAQNAKGETTTFSYYTADAPGKQRKGRLQSIDGPLPGTSDTASLDYDATGSLASVTGPDGYTLAFLYDALDRLTRTTSLTAPMRKRTTNSLIQRPPETASVASPLSRTIASDSSPPRPIPPTAPSNTAGANAEPCPNSLTPWVASPAGGMMSLGA